VPPRKRKSRLAAVVALLLLKSKLRVAVVALLLLKSKPLRSALFAKLPLVGVRSVALTWGLRLSI
jgi:hypothetical protein